MPILELYSTKVFFQELGHSAIAWCSIITKANDQNKETTSIPTPDLHSVNSTDMDCSLSMSDAIVKGKKPRWDLI